MKRSPQKSKTFEQICELQTDGWNGKNYWMCVNEGSVSLYAQTVGEAPTQKIDIPRATFDRMVAWYLKEQELRR